jgi:hypothetical protein
VTAFIKRVQNFVANAAVTTSVFRAKGSGGAMAAAIEFNSHFDLSVIPRSMAFADFLDEQTIALQSTFPPAWRKWGPARKALNIFLRDACYNAFLRKEYDLGGVEPFLETPVDSRIALALHKEASDQKLPHWESIVRLTGEQHRAYQAAAITVARRFGTYPAHLDLWFWRPEAKL